MWIYFWILYSVPLIYVSVFMSVTCYFDYYDSAVLFRISLCDSSNFVLPFQDCPVYLGSFVVPYKFLEYLFYFFEIHHWYVLIGIALNLYAALSSVNILMMLIFPTHEHSMCFHSFVSSSISSFTILKFSKYRSFTALVKLIPRIFSHSLNIWKKI